MASSRLRDLGKVDRRRPTGGNQHDLRASQWGKLGLRELMPQVSEEDQVKALRPEVDDRHLVLGLPLGGLEHADRLDPDAACHFASGR